MRQMIREEGLLCGGSCGAAMSQALKEAKKLNAGQKCVVVLPDSVRNYMTKALSDDWMLDNGFADNEIVKEKQFEQWWANKKVSDIEVKVRIDKERRTVDGWRRSDSKSIAYQNFSAHRYSPCPRTHRPPT